MRFLPLVMLSILSVALATTSGCAFATDPTQGYTVRPHFPTNVKTIAVPIWTRGRDVYRRELEIRLTEAIIKRIKMVTTYTVTTKARADTLLTGSLDTIEQRVLSVNPDTGLPNEKMVTLTVSFRWTDLRSGKILRERKEFIAEASYAPAERLSQDFFQGSEDAINRMAVRVVEQLEEPW